MKVQANFRIKQTSLDYLKLIGKAEDRTVSYLLNKAIEYKQLQLEIKQASKYYDFWDQNRRKLPNAAQTADYFAGRLAKLRGELNDKRQQSNTDGKIGS
jgi:serine phosphatase RsbU (regulator of sigma subunit)